jgi:hypothetical protein
MSRVSLNIEDNNKVCIRINGNELVLSAREFDSLNAEIKWAARVISESNLVEYKTSMYKEIQRETLLN